METLTAVSKKQIVNGMYDSFFKNDLPAILNCMTADVTWDATQNPILSDPRVYSGIESIPSFFKKVGDEIEFTRFEPQNFFERENILFVNGHFEYILKKDNSRWATDGTMRWQFRGEKVEKFSEYFQKPERI